MWCVVRVMVTVEGGWDEVWSQSISVVFGGVFAGKGDPFTCYAGF